LSDRGLLHRSDKVDFPVPPGLQEGEEATDEVVDIEERPRLASIPLDWEFEDALGLRLGSGTESGDNLREDVFASHVGPEDVVGPEDDDAGKTSDSVIEREQLGDDFAAAVRNSGEVFRAGT
jgi:hypothetical protein